MEDAKRQSEHISGISNVTYDLMVALTDKLKAIAALSQYRQDAEEAGDTEAYELFGQLQQNSADDAAKLRGLLSKRLR